MEDKASKDLDSQLSFFAQCMLVFYRKACASQFVYRFFPSLSKLWYSLLSCPTAKMKH